MTTLMELKDLTPDERAVVLNVGQIVLDLIGIVDPTPIADLTNAVISLLRSDYVGVAISSAGAAIPYAGDIAKFANLPRYTRTIENAIALARNNPRLATVLRPLLSKVVSAIDAIPARLIPQSALVSLEQLRNSILMFVGGSRVMTAMDKLTEAILKGLMGSTVNVGALPRRNARLLAEFLVRSKVVKSGEPLTKETIDLFRGTDLHAVEPLEIVRVKAGEKLWQYVDDAAAQLAKNKDKVVSRPLRDGGEKKILIGNWFTRPRGGVSHTNLGISGKGRTLEEFTLTTDVEILVSKSSATADSWTQDRLRAFRSPHGKDLPNKNAELVTGGGEQLFLPNAWKVVRPGTR